MSIIISNRDLVESQGAIQALGRIQGPKVPASLTFGIKRALRSLRAATEDFQEANKTLVEGHAEVDADGNKVILEGGNYKIKDMPSLLKEVDSLLALTVDLPITKLSAKALGDPVPLTPADLNQLDWLFEDDFEG